MVDYSLPRLNMVESQVRPNELTDRRIARVMMEVPREAFLPASLHGLAYSEAELPLDRIDGAGRGRHMLTPRTSSMLIQAMEVGRSDVVLLVGCGTGYEAALVADMVQTVVCLESDPALAGFSEQALAAQDISNVAVVTAPLAAGWPDEGPYDGILINGAVDGVGEALLDQLKDGGRLTAVHRIGEGPVHRVAIWQRVGERFPRIEKGEAAGPVLAEFERHEAFTF